VTDPGAHPPSYLVGNGGIFHQRHGLGHEVDQFFPSSAKVKDASTPYSLIIWYLISRGSNLPLLLLQANSTQWYVIQSDTKKRELSKNPTKIEEIQKKKFIDRN